MTTPPPLFLGTNIPWKNFGYDIGGGAWQPLDNAHSVRFLCVGGSGGGFCERWP